MPVRVPVVDVCTFCEYLAGRRRFTVLHRDDAVAVLVTREQRGSGHVLVIPVAHRETILELTPADEAPLMAAVTRAARAVATATDAEGVSVWQNNGTQAAQSVPHLHVHVAATLPGGGTAWGPVPSLSIDETAVIADCLHPHWRRAG